MPSNSEEILAVAYLEPSRTSTMELFGENRLRLKAVNTFHENAPFWMFDWLLNTTLSSVNQAIVEETRKFNVCVCF